MDHTMTDIFCADCGAPAPTREVWERDTGEFEIVSLVCERCAP